jgi:Mg-chelatase subunit ChlI
MTETTVRAFTQTVTDNVEQVMVGKRKVIDLLMVALLCQGHVLIEDVPGVGKTMLARSISISLGGIFKRLQCTPDLLPNDVTGVSIFNQQTAQFEFRPGPVFVNVLLADEINRATPRTQSALLEAMSESQVSVDGVSRSLPTPFLVLATQNPVEYEGTFPLPEAQLDRFLMRVSMGYPTPAEERRQPVTCPAAANMGRARGRFVARVHRATRLCHAQSPRPGIRRQPARQPGAIQDVASPGCDERARSRAARRYQVPGALYAGTPPDRQTRSGTAQPHCAGRTG